MTDHAYDMRFSGIGRLYGTDGLAALRAAHVAVIGVGGVGSWTAEALARSGVGAITLVDLDDVCVTNTNRQLHALDGSVGRPKIDVMAERIRLINPGCRVATRHAFFTDKTAAELVEPGLSWVVDAIDNPVNKCLLITRCRDAGVPVVICGGAGGRRDPSRVKTADLTVSEGDGLLRRVRKQLRQRHGFTRRGRWGIPCVYSDEPAVFPGTDGGVCDTRDQAETLRLDCATGFGTASFVTGTFGFAAAAVVVGGIAAPA